MSTSSILSTGLQPAATASITPSSGTSSFISASQQPPAALSLGSSSRVSIAIPSINDFQILKPLSKGAYGTVYLAKKRSTSVYYAIKVLSKSKMISKNLIHTVRSERMTMIHQATLDQDNPHVVKLVWSFQSKHKLYLVLEYMNGGDCAALIRNMGHLDENWTRSYIAETVLGIERIHRLDIAHRDLKPDNLLIGPDGHIKLVDFGLSSVGYATRRKRLASEAKSTRRFVGTPDYIPYETLLGDDCGVLGDFWALGIICYEFLYGYPPFHGDSPEEVFANILEKPLEFPDENNEDAAKARDFIRRLLDRNPDTRLGAPNSYNGLSGAAAVKAHPFLANYINWDTLLTEEPAFVPHPDDPEDTGYFDAR
ncbi:kinase-like protein, partial [Ramicandelaber brevisporus]